jgi:hypothetical protein
MRRLLLLVALGVTIVPGMRAQEFDRVQVGAYADYFRMNETSSNFAGLGGRFGISVLPHTKLEAEMSYDFNQVFSEGFTNTSGGTVTFQNTGMRALHGLFGPKVELGHSMFRPFVELKGGFVNFQFDARPASFDTFVSSVENLRSQNINGVLMPGAGLEGRLGPLGIRMDVGDEVYFNHGTRHNFRLMFGPFVRF